MIYKVTVIGTKAGTHVPIYDSAGHIVNRIKEGVETTVNEEFYQYLISSYTCRVGYFVNDSADIASLPTTGIVDGSYAFIMSTQEVKFLSEGSWQ